MLDQLVKAIVDESKWLTASMGFALLAVAVLLHRHRHSDITARRRIQAAMNLFFSATIGIMALGHLLAVTTKLASRTLEGPVLVFYLIGAALAAPSWWLVDQTRRTIASADDRGQTTLRLNVWLVVTLLALGVHNLPLAAPGFLNIGYHLHSGRVLGWAIASLAVAVNVGLFIGSLVFLASGQSFEQLRGIQ